jgi:hypothetical protein
MSGLPAVDMCVSVSARHSGIILVNASRTADIFCYIAHIDYTQFIGGLKPI